MAAPPAGPIPEGKTFGLFVCAATREAKDVWMFADFQATAKAFMATGGMTGTYINLFDYATFLENLPPDAPKRIAWGYQGTNTGDPLIEFKAGDRTFWQQISEKDYADALDLIVKEIRGIAGRAKFPDKVNIFFFCHGGDDDGGFLEIGPRRLSYKTLNRIIAKEFNFGVQVNIVVAACYFGLLVEKIKAKNMKRRTVQTSANAMQLSYSFRQKSTSGQWRGSPFVAAFASSLQQGLESVRARQPDRTVQEHFDYVNSLGGFGDPAKSGSTQAWQGDGPEGAIDAVLNVLFRSYHVRTRTGGELPELAFTPPQPGGQLTPQGGAPASASQIGAHEKYMRGIQYELERLQDPEEPSHNNDKGFFTCIFYLQTLKNSEDLLKQWGRFFKGMRWRFRVQEFFFVVFHDLLRDELIDEKALETPMDIGKYDPDVSRVVALLSCFEIGALCSSRSATFGNLVHELGYGNFNMPLRWLAILIVRSHPETELLAIASYLLNSRKLGELREEFLRESGPITVRHVPEACRADTEDQRKAYELAFVLPTHENLKLWAEETLMRYEHYQGMFDDFYGRNSWGGKRFGRFKKFLDMYKTTDLSDIIGPRVRRHETYLDNLSPLSPISGSSSSATAVSSVSATSSSPLTEYSPRRLEMPDSPFAGMTLGMESEGDDN